MFVCVVLEQTAKVGFAFCTTFPLSCWVETAGVVPWGYRSVSNQERTRALRTLEACRVLALLPV